MMHCSNCGIEVDAGARFCQECGAGLAPEETSLGKGLSRRRMPLKAAITVSIVIATLGLLVVASMRNQGRGNPAGPWPHFRGPHGTGRCPQDGPTDPHIKWLVKLGEEYGESPGAPVVAADGTIYLTRDNTLYAITPEGTLKWDFVNYLDYGDDWLGHAPLVTADGSIWVGSANDVLYAISPDGVVNLRVPLSETALSAPVAAPDGQVCIQSNWGVLYAVTRDGQVAWQMGVPENWGSYFLSPSISQNGTLYFADGSQLMAVSPDGTTTWKFDVETPIATAPVIGVDGTVYAVSQDGFLVAVNPKGSGTLKWKVGLGKIDTGGVGPPALGPDGSIYIGSSEGVLYCVRPDGDVSWTFETKGETVSAPAVDGRGNIYVGGDETDGYLYSLNPAGRVNWKMYVEPTSSAPAVGADGTLYTGSRSGHLVAIEQASPGTGRELIVLEGRYGGDWRSRSLEWDGEWPDGLVTSLEPSWRRGVEALCINGWVSADIVPNESQPGDVFIVQSATTGRRYEVIIRELQSGRNEGNELIVTRVKLELRDVTAEGR